MAFTETGVPTYVNEGYVTPGYQAYTSTNHGLPSGTPPAQGIEFQSPQTPPNWPSLPPTLPPSGSPTGASYWRAGPTEAAGEQMGYNPPTETTTDDGVRFPASQGDLILSNSWHGTPSTLNPGNQTIYNAQLAATIKGALSTVTGTDDYSSDGSDTVSFSITAPNWAAITAAVTQAVQTSIMQGEGLWYELVLKPVTNGPFSSAYVVNTTPLLIPKTIDLAAPSTGG